MARKITFNEALHDINAVKPRIEVLEAEYITAKTKMRCRCKDCGYEFLSTYDLLRRNSNTTGCPKCSGNLKKTLEEVVKIIFNISPSVRILSTEYKNARSNLHCFCEDCSHEWLATYDNLRKGKKCPKCSGNIKKTLEEVKQSIFEKYSNIIVTDTEYHNVDHVLHLKCSVDSYEWETSYHNIMSGHNCPKCLGNERTTIELAKKRTARIAPNIEILTDHCENVKQPLKCRCKNCGSIFETNLNSITSGVNCMECFRKRMVGEGHHQWKGGVTELNNFLRTKISPWKTMSMEKCNYKCVITGEPFDDIHHVYGFNRIVQDTLNAENLPIHPIIGDYTQDELERLANRCLAIHFEHELGVCLTKKMHEKFHKQYSYHTYTVDDFGKFLKEERMGKQNDSY